MDDRTGRAGWGGFTLLELILVITVIGITATMLFSQLDMRQVKVNASSRSLVMFVLAAQQRAVLSQRNVMVLFDTAAGRVVMHVDENNDGERDGNERVRTLEMETGVRFTRGLAPAGPPGDSVLNMRRVGDLPGFVFHRNGSASEGAGFYLGTDRSRTEARHVSDVRAYTIDRGTGQVVRWILESGQWRRETL